MFQTTAEAKGDGLDPVKYGSATHTPIILLLTFRGGTFVVVPRCYLNLCPCVYRLKQCGHLNNTCPLCFLFCSVLLSETENSFQNLIIHISIHIVSSAIWVNI